MLLSSLAITLSLAMFQAPPPASAPDVASAYKELQAAEEKKDAGLVKKWAVETLNQAQASLKADPDADADIQKSRIGFAKEVQPHAEYALATAALASTDHKQVIDLRDTLAQIAPDSKYLVSLNAKYLEALQGTGNQKKEFPFAEKAVAKDPGNEALIAILADGYYSRKAWAQAANYGTKLATVSKRPAMVGRGYFLAGNAYVAMGRHSQADKALRAALPIVKSEPGLYAQTLFQLGLADYNLAHQTHDRVLMKEAAAFSEQCSKLNSPWAGQAGQNAFTMKKELAAFR